jgi:hypothetical protein
MVILITFLWDYAKIIVQGGFLKGLFSLATDRHFQNIVTSYIPSTYNWTLFVFGEFLIFCSLAIFFRRMKSVR